MPRVDQDLELYTNADEVFTIAVTDDADVPIDLTTFTSLCWILSKNGITVVSYDDTDPEVNIAAVDAANDGLRVNLDAAVTGALECGRIYIHQAWGTIGGRERPLCVGYVTVKRGDGC